MKKIRQQFSIEWDLLNSNIKSAIISVFAFFIAVGLLNIVKWLFPDFDIQPLILILLTAFSGWFANFVKENIKV